MTEPLQAEAPSDVWPMYRALVGVGLVCGVLIVGAHELTAPVIADNRARALRAAVLEVLPGARRSVPFAFYEGRFVREGEVGPTVHAGYDDAGALVGVAIEAQGMGYQDVIRLLYGYDPHAEAIVGLAVLDSRETPGLGDKIGLDPAFLQNFERLDVRLDDTRAGLRHPIEAVKHGEKTEPWQIDAITGATVSSRAVARILRDSTALWVPRVARHAQELTP